MTLCIVSLIYGVDGTFPNILTITPKGIDKLRETYITRIQDTAYNNPWIVVTIVVSLILGIITVIYYSENIGLQNENIKLQNKIIQNNELKQTMPSTASLTQDYPNEWYGVLEIKSALYFKKNSDRLFTISNWQANFTLNGKPAGDTPVSYPMRYLTEELPYNVSIKSDVHTALINYSEFFHNSSNELVVDYVLEIKDMDSQIVYRGNVTTEIDSYRFPPKTFPSGREPLIFNWTKV